VRSGSASRKQDNDRKAGGCNSFLETPSLMAEIREPGPARFVLAKRIFRGDYARRSVHGHSSPEENIQTCNAELGVMEADCWDSGQRTSSITATTVARSLLSGITRNASIFSWTDGQCAWQRRRLVTSGGSAATSLRRGSRAFETQVSQTISGGLAGVARTRRLVRVTCPACLHPSEHPCRLHRRAARMRMQRT
jgi:hypothetical protein